MPNISDLKRYAVVDSSEDDFVLGKCMAAAERYLVNAGVLVPTEEDPLYDLCVYQLAVHYYDNRVLLVTRRSSFPLASPASSISSVSEVMRYVR